MNEIDIAPFPVLLLRISFSFSLFMIRKKKLKIFTIFISKVLLSSLQVEPGCDQGTQVSGQIVIEGVSSVASNLTNEAAAVLIDASKRKIQFIDKDSLVVRHICCLGKKNRL